MEIQSDTSTWGRVRAACSVVYAPLFLVFAIGTVATPVLARAVDLDRVVVFSIEQQSIESALIAFSKQAHIQVIISPRINGTTEVAALNATVSARVALEILLRNTGLTYAASGESVNVTRLGDTSSADAGVGAQQDDSNGASSSSSAKQRKNSSADLRVAHADQGVVARSEAMSAPDSSPPAPVQEVIITGHYQFLSVDTSGATNLPLPIEQVPQSISLVSNDFIHAADLKTLGEIAEYTPGAINEGNGENLATVINLRGFPAGQSIDGVNVLGRPNFEPDYAVYDRLEIVKGPSSVVYGVSSPGGLVNYVTKSATAQTRDYLYAQAGSWSNYRVEGQIAGALDAEGHVRAIGIAVHDQGDSFMHEMYHRKTTVYGGLNVDLGSSVTAYLHGGYEWQKEPSFDGIPTEADGSPAPLSRSFFIGSRNIAQAHNAYHSEGDLTWHATDMLDLSIKGNYQKATVSGAQTFPFSLQSNGDFSIYGNTIDQRISNYGIGVSSILRFDNLGLKNSFVSLGALYQNSDIRLIDLFPAQTGTVNISDGEAAISRAFDSLLAGALPYPYAAHTKADALTFSGQSNLQVIEPLTVLLGVSYSKPKESVILNGVRQDFPIGGQASYRAGLTYEFLPKTYAYVSYSQSFNPQTSLALDGTALPPITGKQYELGVKYRDESGRLLLTAAAFQVREKNIPETFVEPNGLAYSVPIGEVTHKGLELQGIGQITRQWQINTGYAYLDPKITEDLNPAKVDKTELFLPKQTFSLYTTYTLSDGLLRGLSFGGGARFVSSQRTSYDASTKELPSYVLVDATLGYTWDEWLLQLNAHNIFDRHYFINNYQSLTYGNLVGDPANIALSIRRQF
jgi:TonB-dependent siderophore receptor